MLRVRMFDLHYILCYIEKLSCQETWWAPGDMMSKKAACFAVEINTKCPRSSVGRARDPGPCGRGFERHGGRSFQILRLCLAVLLAGLLGCDVLARCPTLLAAAKEIMPVNLFQPVRGSRSLADIVADVCWLIRAHTIDPTSQQEQRRLPPPGIEPGSSA